MSSCGATLPTSLNDAWQQPGDNGNDGALIDQPIAEIAFRRATVYDVDTLVSSRMLGLSSTSVTFDSCIAVHNVKDTALDIKVHVKVRPVESFETLKRSSDVSLHLGAREEKLIEHLSLSVDMSDFDTANAGTPRFVVCELYMASQEALPPTMNRPRRLLRYAWQLDYTNVP